MSQNGKSRAGQASLSLISLPHFSLTLFPVLLLSLSFSPAVPTLYFITEKEEVVSFESSTFSRSYSS